MSVKRERMSVTMAPIVREYVVKASEDYGMSISAFITMCVQNYKVNNEALAEMSKVQSYFDQMRELGIVNQPSEIKASDENVVSIAQS